MCIRDSPNSDVANQTIRSKQEVDNRQLTSSDTSSGVPGALTNQPVPTPSAPIDGENEPKDNDKDEQQKMYHLQSNSTLNYEVNRQVIHSKIPEGRIKRLSVAILVNYKFVTTNETQSSNEESSNNEDKDNNATEKWVKLDQEELANIEALARQAMGFSDARGDSLTVANLKFTDQILDEGSDKILFWEKHELYDMVKTGLKYLIYILVAWYAWRKVLRPLWIRLKAEYLKIFDKKEPDSKPSEIVLTTEDNVQQQQRIREIVGKDPRVMALIIRGWMSKKDKKK